MVNVALGLCLLIVALLVVWRATPWLVRGGHRYPDEAALPTRRFRWVLPTSTGAVLVIGVGGGQRPAHAAVCTAFAVFLILVCAIDVDVRRLPDRWTYPAMLGAPLATGLLALVDRDGAAWLRSLLAGLALAVVYLVLVLIGGASGLGLGDAKLAPSIGVILGYLSWAHVVVATLFAILIGGIVAGVLLVSRRGRSSFFAFGPAMSAGAMIVMVGPGVAVLARGW